MKQKEFSMKEYLKQIVELYQQMYNQNKRNKIGDYYCLEDFILKNGQPFEISPLPKNIKRGAMKECFRNSAMLAMENADYFYAEGFAFSIIPTIHGWCANREGKAIDPTWDDGKEYFGVIFKRDYLFKYLLKYKRYGLIENWENGYPLLRLDKKIWQQKIL